MRVFKFLFYFILFFFFFSALCMWVRVTVRRRVAITHDKEILLRYQVSNVFQEQFSYIDVRRTLLIDLE